MDIEIVFKNCGEYSYYADRFANKYEITAHQIKGDLVPGTPFRIVPTFSRPPIRTAIVSLDPGASNLLAMAQDAFKRRGEAVHPTDHIFKVIPVAAVHPGYASIVTWLIRYVNQEELDIITNGVQAARLNIKTGVISVSDIMDRFSIAVHVDDELSTCYFTKGGIWTSQDEDNYAQKLYWL